MRGVLVTTKKRSTSARDLKARRIDLGPLADSAGYLLRRAQLAVFADLIASLEDVDVRPGLFGVLVVIGRNPGLTQSEVSEVLGIKRANFVAVVNDLEQRGWVVRGASPTDRRANTLELSVPGQAVLARVLELHAAHERRLARKLGVAQRDTLVRLLRQIAATEAAGGTRPRRVTPRT